ncbi:MAG: thioesterase family protein [Salaquimonas sp.]|nr:thioesterase family protein [Salaquimonas sp.]
MTVIKTPGEPFLETYRGFVNTWDCDENAHMNVQFYFRAFQQASEIFALAVSGTNPGARTAILRHVRYHRELHVARSTIIHSAILGEGEAAGSVVHLMRDADSGELAATALDQPGYRIDGVPVCGLNEAAPALPRGVGYGPTQPVDTRTLIKQGRALISSRTVARIGESGPDGDILSNALISRLTDAAAHVWNFAGITTEWLTGTMHGRVAVETKLTRLRRIEPGTGLALVSWIETMEENTFLMRHQLEEMTSGEPVAASELRCLVMNLETRRAVPIPQFARDNFAARQI